jgi:hypothetical protein
LCQEDPGDLGKQLNLVLETMKKHAAEGKKRNREKTWERKENERGRKRHTRE